ncbi:hypothetical protein PybrP1_010744 [[Pythium] brassicae (nom. inval.)]|nr:hypothetical protein PybrP1_010744 [[Pythium] brassicae (nom. inval.)]
MLMSNDWHYHHHSSSHSHGHHQPLRLPPPALTAADMQRRRDAYVLCMATQQQQEPFALNAAISHCGSAFGIVGAQRQLFPTSSSLTTPFDYPPPPSPPSPSSAHAYLFADPASQSAESWITSTAGLATHTPLTSAMLENIEDAKLLHEVLQASPSRDQFDYPQSLVSATSSMYPTPMGIYRSPEVGAQVAAPDGESPAGSSASAASGSAAGSDTGVGINIDIGMTLGGIGLSSDMGMMTLTPLGSNSASTPPATTKKKPASRICRVPGCMKGIRSRGLCKGHGGGRRCTTPGCEISDQGGGHCIAHGGGKRCHVAGCVKSAQSKGLCKLHGGARRCKVAECSKNCQVKGLCRLHYGMTASASRSTMSSSPSSPFEFYGNVSSHE